MRIALGLIALGALTMIVALEIVERRVPAALRRAERVGAEGLEGNPRR